MNSQERVLAVLNGEIPDRVPLLEVVVENKIIKDMFPGKSIIDFYEEIDLDGMVIFEDIPWEKINSRIKKDHFGVLRDFRDVDGDSWPLPVEPLINNNQTVDFLYNYQLPDPHDPARLSTLKKAVKRFKGKKAIIFGMHSSLLYPSFIRGFDNLLIDYIIDPDFAKRLTDKIVDYFVELEALALEIGADAVVECEDYCSKKGPFFSEKHFKEFVLPGLKRTINIAKNYNAPFMKHTDGNVWSLLDILIDAGINAYNPIEPAAGMDIGNVKEIYGKKITLWGNVDSSTLMVNGGPEEVEQSVKNCIKIASPGGRYIMCSSSGIHSHVLPKNFIAMIESTRKFGKYPINI